MAANAREWTRITRGRGRKYQSHDPSPWPHRLQTSGLLNDLHRSDTEPNEASGSYRRECALTGDGDVVALGEPGGESEGLADVLLFQIRKVCQQLLRRAAR